MVIYGKFLEPLQNYRGPNGDMRQVLRATSKL